MRKPPNRRPQKTAPTPSPKAVPRQNPPGPRVGQGSTEGGLAGLARGAGASTRAAQMRRRAPRDVVARSEAVTLASWSAQRGALGWEADWEASLEPAPPPAQPEATPPPGGRDPGVTAARGIRACLRLAWLCPLALPKGQSAIPGPKARTPARPRVCTRRSCQVGEGHPRQHAAVPTLPSRWLPVPGPLYGGSAVPCPPKRTPKAPRPLSGLTLRDADPGPTLARGLRAGGSRFTLGAPVHVQGRNKKPRRSGAKTSGMSSSDSAQGTSFRPNHPRPRPTLPIGPLAYSVHSG